MQKTKQSAISYIILIGASTLFMLLFAYNTSPLFKYIGVDSGMYLVIGKAMAQGETLYSGLFDHKGPIIFILNMLPQLIFDGTIGVWFTELILLIISSILIYKIADRYIRNAFSLCVPFIYIWVNVTLFNGGNYTEEYSNFFCVISLFIFDKWQRDKKLTSSMSYILGLCFAFVFFLRPNNVAFIISVILFMGIYMLMKSREKTTKVGKPTLLMLIRSALIFFSLGILTVMFPLIIYHLFTGTLYDMFYATVLHNIKYCVTGHEHFRLIPNGNSALLLCFFIALGINIVAMCTCYSNSEIKMGNFILLSIPLICSALLIGRHPFMYYWTLLAPLTAYSAIFIIKHGMNIKKKSLSVFSLIMVFALMCTNSFWGTEIPEKKSYITEYKSNALQMYDVIPEEEKNACFAYNMPSMFIYEVNLNTPCKYFTMQTWMAKTNPDIAEYCTRYVKENNPKWILSYFNFESDNTNLELSTIMRTGYTQVFNNDCGYLYKKVETSQ